MWEILYKHRNLIYCYIALYLGGSIAAASLMITDWSSPIRYIVAALFVVVSIAEIE